MTPEFNCSEESQDTYSLLNEGQKSRILRKENNLLRGDDSAFSYGGDIIRDLTDRDNSNSDYVQSNLFMETSTKIVVGDARIYDNTYKKFDRDEEILDDTQFGIEDPLKAYDSKGDLNPDDNIFYGQADRDRGQLSETSESSQLLNLNSFPLTENLTSTATELISGGNNGSNPPAENLNPNLPPSGNFDLLDWTLSIPVDANNDNKADTIKEVPLSQGFEDSRYFYTNQDGGMVFTAPIGGAKTSTNTKYTRTELREMLRRGNTDFSTKGVGGNNWVFSSAPSQAQDAAGGVDGELTATLAVNHVTTTGDRSQVGRVIIGQIHANSDEPVRLYYRKLPGNEKGSIYIAHEPRTGPEQWYEIIGSRSSSASNPVDGIGLNEKFSYKINVVGNLLTVTIIRPGKPNVVQQVNMDGSGYDDPNQYMYFKAGVYNQNNTGDPNDYVQATFYQLDNKHTGYSPNPNPVDVINPTPVDVTNPNPVDIINPNPVEIINPNPVDVTNPTPVDVINPNPVDVINPTPGSSGIDFSLVNNWNSGFQGKIDITNQGDNSLNGWTIEFESANEIKQIWNAEIVSHDGNRYVIRNANYNGTVAPGQKISFGFIATGSLSTEPSNFQLI